MPPRLLYESDRCMVFHATQAELCADLGDMAVNVTITDPPYTEHVHANIRSCNTTGKIKVKAWNPGFPALEGYEHVPELLRVTQRWVFSFCALESFGSYMLAAGGMRSAKGAYVRSGIWRKKQAAPSLCGRMPGNSCEGIALMHRRTEGDPMHWNGGGKHAYYTEDDECFYNEGRDRAEKRHPCAKPRKLMLRIVEDYTEPGEWILDPYAGGGSTGWAALELGRNVILADADEDWAMHCARTALELDRSNRRVSA